MGGINIIRPEEIKIHLMQVMRGFREASVQGQSPNPSLLMEQVNLIYPNLT